MFRRAAGGSPPTATAVPVAVGDQVKHGDVLEIEVEGLGRQRNRVVFPGETGQR